ncbi:geranylgeranylglycerol-phosphate geranylgeranyltransferase [Halopenitus malekzadehii]|uniref:Digeranylgeranylglyceryl phosphate synthase n=1 Tax=Halopenitus malekzadehii TaxID=1267564 RepID=A0A1H6I2M1_9EURY|nr:geranylgeranylglycerol-phosphate geranylgeranyltransferase [Halopenitus malekzadehii]SEH41734.1 geranylgeranylglycerol-phosphate geranylgeranyltransferase [Halopenitus malekzadehii]
MSMRRQARGAIELTRPLNAIAAGVLTGTGAYVAGGAILGADRVVVLAAVVATVCATGAGNAVNDYFDREIDRVNRPDRPIPRGAITARGALLVSLGLFAGAVVTALLLPPAAIALAVFNLVLLVAYTELFKGLPGVGNVVVGFLTGSTFLFGGAAVGSPLEAGALFVLAAIATVTREIIKDVEDVAGDREEGLTTLPIAIGERRSLWIGLALLVVAIVASAGPFLWGTFGRAYLVLIVPADAVMLVAAVQSFSDPASAQRRVKAGMFLAVIAFIAGRAVPLG